MVPKETIERVLDKIDPAELIDLTTNLIKINSVWDPAAGTNEKPVADFVVEWAKAKGFEFEVNEVSPGRPNVIITWGTDARGRTLMFEGHTDVVTPGEMSAWNYDPFGAEIVGRRMYGRGTNDTKGNLAAMLIAMSSLKGSGVKLAGNIVGGVLCDEEDQMTGVMDFIEKGHADSVTGAVICEPQDGMICTSQKGAIRACYTIIGRMGHGAMPLSGLNTAPGIARLIDGLHRLESSAAKKSGKDQHLGWPSFTPTVIQSPAEGPPQLNVMPRSSKVLVDIRTVHGQSHTEVKKDITHLADDVKKSVCEYYQAYDKILNVNRPHNLDVIVEFLSDRPCTLTDAQDPLVLAADWATRQLVPEDPVYGGVPGATDGTFLWALKGIPIVTMGAGDRQVPHQVDEWVDLDQLIETAKIYALTALHYLYH